ncbi:MAG: type II secretion system protein N, partial [Chromatocurvus sp.]
VILLLQLLWAGSRILLAGNVQPVAPAADSLMVAEVPRPQSVDATDSAAVQARPLFWAERRPTDPGASAAALEEAAAAQNERAAPKMKDVALLGVFGSGKTGGAIVAVKGKQERVAVGDTVQDWRLLEVAANRAVFVSGGARDERELLPRIIAPPVDAAGDVIEPGAGQGNTAADAEEEGSSLSLLGQG